MGNWYKKGQPLLDEIRDTVLPENTLALWFIGQCGYIVKYQDTVLLIDPVLNDITGSDGTTRKYYEIPFAPQALHADFVMCTHGHIDHMAGETLSGLAEANSEIRFILPSGCRSLAEQYGLDPAHLLLMQDGAEQELSPEIKVHTVSTAHPTHVLNADSVDMALGCCVRFGQISLVHLGDTYLTERLFHSLMELPAPNIFLPPINGDDYFRMARNCIGNMEAEEAAKLAVRLHADLSMPTHFDMIMDNTVDPLRFGAELRRIQPSAKWHIPALGERILYQL